MYAINQGISKFLFLDSDGKNRKSCWSQCLQNLWRTYAILYLKHQRKRLPPQLVKRRLAHGGCTVIKQWNHGIQDGRAHLAGYVLVTRYANSVELRSSCKSDFLGPSAENCVYVDGSPLPRNGTIQVSLDARIEIIGFAHRDDVTNNSQKALIQIKVLPFPHEDHPYGT